MKPLLLLDVDGVLNPTGRPSPDFRRYRCTIGSTVYTVHLNQRHGTRLMELALETGSELVWATTWEQHANEWIAPRLGLPPLPVIEMAPGENGSRHGEMFKTRHVAEYVGDRPFVWFDDQVYQEDEDYLRARQGLGEFLLVHVPGRVGLTSRHLAAAREWLTLTGFSQGQ
ncbi:MULTISPECIES: HAD domain-containing protein [Nonomuraea]|uniref:HAD domain-containing protein n=1 Tax=Nonomuraea ferruginea TaxID=46174 RepID=A0ABT4SRK7_9ACTN|nr:HAD domain-containing protein [Nonomuraea ferruginea]MDA0639685.1 HAD domain-containing protein [Nonomuraea ferruginea]